MKRLWYYYIYLFLVWGAFRYFVKLPDVIEELWFKPLIWLIPIFWWNLSLKERISFFGFKKITSIMLGILVGVIYFILVRRFNLTGVKWDVNLVGIAMATAVTEELTFSGFVTAYLDKKRKDKATNLLIVGIMVALIRLPILIFVYKVDWITLVGVFMFAGASGVINAWIRSETGNVTGSIIARIGMNLATLG